LTTGTLNCGGPLTITQNSDTIVLRHDGTNCYFNTSDGPFIFQTDEPFIFQTDEGTNTYTDVRVYGKGSQPGYLTVYDGGDTYAIQIGCVSGEARVYASGGATHLAVQEHAGGNLTCFEDAAEGETPAFTISGYRTGDAKRTFAACVGGDAADTFSQKGLEAYRWYGAGDTDYAELSFDTHHTYLKWSDGYLYLETDEGTNTDTYVNVRGKGTGQGYLLCHDTFAFMVSRPVTSQSTITQAQMLLVSVMPQKVKPQHLPSLVTEQVIPNAHFPLPLGQVPLTRSTSPAYLPTRLTVTW